MDQGVQYRAFETANVQVISEAHTSLFTSTELEGATLHRELG